jgi:enamine deaminase RidA (YjgF/YER057c/UK114 family)
MSTSRSIRSGKSIYDLPGVVEVSLHIPANKVSKQRHKTQFITKTNIQTQAPKFHFSSNISTKMATLPKHFNAVAGAMPYKDLFTKVTIVPANCSLAFISTQFACDPETGELPVDIEGDYAKQSAKIWEQIVAMLKELGLTMTEVVHFTVNFS